MMVTFFTVYIFGDFSELDILFCKDTSHSSFTGILLNFGFAKDNLKNVFTLIL